MNEQKNSDIHLRPRFKIDVDESQEKILKKFKDSLNDTHCTYCGKIVDEHIVIDIASEENHFWSPQLNIEIEKVGTEKAIVKGLFGPKPQVWTLFMFFHFAIAVAFIGFSVMAYVKWTLKTDYTLALTIVVFLPVLWVVMYFLGRIGRKKGHGQMDELYAFMMTTLQKK